MPVGCLPSPTLQSIRHNADNLAHGVPVATCQRLEALRHRRDDISSKTDPSLRAVCAMWLCGAVGRTEWVSMNQSKDVDGRGEGLRVHNV